MVYGVGKGDSDRGHVTEHVTRIDDVSREAGNTTSPPTGLTAGMGNLTLQGVTGRSPTSTYAGASFSSAAAPSRGMGGAQTTTSWSGVGTVSSSAPTLSQAEFPARMHGRQLPGSGHSSSAQQADKNSLGDQGSKSAVLSIYNTIMMDFLTL